MFICTNRTAKCYRVFYNKAFNIYFVRFFFFMITDLSTRVKDCRLLKLYESSALKTKHAKPPLLYLLFQYAVAATIIKRKMPLTRSCQMFVEFQPTLLNSSSIVEM